MNTVRSWLGLPERILMKIWNEFRQVSENLGFKMDFEDILGIVAISTFLVGFSSVRLQSILEERKESEARKIDRVLEQNAGKDLLPLPTSLGQMDNTQDKFSEDKTTSFTILLTWFNFIISSLLIGVHQVNSDVSPFPFWLVQIVHLCIVLIGSFGPKFVDKQFLEYQKKQPFSCYEEMMIEIEKSLKCDKNTENLEQKITKFDASVPEWSWLTLIRCSLLKDTHNPQLKRIYDLVEPQKNADDYSLIAFVWSAYLLDNGDDDSISRTVQYSDIEKILIFGTPKFITNEDQDSGNSTSKEPTDRPQVLQDFLQRTFSTPVDSAFSSQIFVRLAVREILRVWSPDVLNGSNK